MKEETITWDEFEEKYEPKKNHLVKGSSYNECLYETYGEEITFVKKQNYKTIWTVLDNNEGEGFYILSGWHFVNRIGYIITKNEWNKNVETFVEENE